MTKEEAKKILTEYVKACREDDFLTLEQFTYEEVIEAMNIGAKAISVLLMNKIIDGKVIFLLNGDVAINIGDTDEYKLGKNVRVIVLPKEDGHEDK